MPGHELRSNSEKKTVSDAASKRLDLEGTTFQFKDNRAETTTQNYIQQLANQSEQTNHIAQLQSMANRNQQHPSNLVDGNDPISENVIQRSETLTLTTTKTKTKTKVATGGDGGDPPDPGPGSQTEFEDNDEPAPDNVADDQEAQHQFPPEGQGHVLGSDLTSLSQEQLMAKLESPIVSSASKVNIKAELALREQPKLQDMCQDIAEELEFINLTNVRKLKGNIERYKPEKWKEHREHADLLFEQYRAYCSRLDFLRDQVVQCVNLTQISACELQLGYLENNVVRFQEVMVRPCEEYLSQFSTDKSLIKVKKRGPANSIKLTTFTKAIEILGILPVTGGNSLAIAKVINNHPTNQPTGLTVNGNMVYHCSKGSKQSLGTCFWTYVGGVVVIVAWGGHAKNESDTYQITWKNKDLNVKVKGKRKNIVILNSTDQCFE